MPNKELIIDKIKQFTKDIIVILNETTDNKLVELYKEVIAELAHVVLYLLIQEDVMFRMGSLGFIISKLKDQENFDKIYRDFQDLLSLLIEEYRGRLGDV